MPGRGNKKLSKTESMQNKKWLLGGYGRRSFDDCDDNESNTIKNQRLLIDEHIQGLENIEIYDYYLDDGYTGTNFDRPDFKRMMQDIRNGKINGVIFKDLSRLGRNHKETGKYVEEIFPIYNLRIISINDNVDSFLDPESINNLIIPIKNLMNESYSRDISKKVSSAYKMMAKNGQYVSGTPPYGYMIDPEDKHHLIINEEEAINVRTIFELALKGNGRIKICKYLNDNGILCRKEIQRRKKHNLSLEPFEVDTLSFWGTTQIGRILTSETYIGNLAQLKTTRSSFGINKYITKSSEEWIKVENTHEAIISKDDFRKVQKMAKEKNFNGAGTSYNYSIFNGILKCADCGRAMLRQIDNRKSNRISNYYCSTHLRASKLCSSHKIKTETLEEIVKEAIHLQVKLVIELDKSIKKLFFKSNEKEYELEYKNNIRISEIKIDSLKEKKREAYKEWKFQKMEKDEFIKLSEEIEQEIKIHLENIELYNSTYKETIKRIRKDEYWINHYKRNKNIKKLSRTVLKELVDIILIDEKGNVNIKFKYQDEYNNLIKYLEGEVVKQNEKVDNWLLSKTFSR